MPALRSPLPLLALLLLVPACDFIEELAAACDETQASSGPLRAVQVAAGNGAACAVMSDGTARCWGRNDDGLHGTEPSTIDAATPVVIPGVEDAREIWIGGEVEGFIGEMACVRTGEGKVVCWGATNKPQVKGKTWTAAAEEIAGLEGAEDLALGGGTMYALLGDGSVAAWRPFGPVGEFPRSDDGLTKVPKVAKATAIAAGAEHACALLGDGKVSCWDSTKLAATTVEGLSDVLSIGAGPAGDDTCAVTKDGTVKCWGADRQLHEQRGVSDASLVRARKHTCVLTHAGAVQCWGDEDPGANLRGQMGTGKIDDTNAGKARVVDLGKAVDLDVGEDFACAVIDDGNVECWGLNSRGQLGDGTLLDRAKPVTVAALTAPVLPPPQDGADQVHEGDVAMDWSDLPSGCTKPTTIDATSKLLEGEFHVVSGYAVDHSFGPTVTLASFEMEPKRIGDGPRGDQFQLELEFHRKDPETKKLATVDAGEYALVRVGERTVGLTMLNKATSTRMRPTLSSQRKVSITHVDDTWICGELKLDTEDAKFKGPWAARVVK